MDTILTRNWKRTPSTESVHGTEALARRYLEAGSHNALVLARSRTVLDAFRAHIGTPVLGSVSIHTVHSFCRRVLRENALDAVVDPRFSILGEAQWRIMAGRLLDELIESRHEDLAWLGFLQEDDPTLVRECVLSICRKPDLTPARAADPFPFLESFERCCMELTTWEDVPEKIIQPIRANLPVTLLTAHRLVSLEPSDEYGKALRKFRKFRGRFNKKTGFADLDHTLESARNAYDDFVAACNDRHSALCADFLQDLIAEFNDLCSDEKSRLGLLDYDDLLGRACHLLSDTEIARRYQDRFDLVLAHTDGFGDLERQIIEAISRPDGLFCLESTQLPGNGGISSFIDYLLGNILAEEPGMEPQPVAPIQTEPSPVPDVELIVVPRAFIHTADSTARRHRSEAAVIAERILEMTARSVDHRDILVLLRSPFDLRTYERVLENHGIPTYAIGARGFFEAPQIRDMVSMLRAICRPNDKQDHLLSDDLIQELRSIETTAAEVLDLILERTYFDLKLLPMRGGLRKYANVRRFRDMAGDESPSDFLARIEEQMPFGSHEPESPVRSPDGNVVRIMTIHDASEIQAPIVFIADLSRRIGPEIGITAFDPDRGLAVRPPSLVGVNTPLNYREISEVVRDRALPQEASLLRTALTHAQERLFLVGSSDLTGGDKPTYRETTSWMGWIKKALELSPGSRRGIKDLGTCQVSIQFTEPKTSVPEPVADSLSARFTQELREGLPIPMDNPSAAQIADEAIHRCLAEGAPTPRHVTRLSVSQALDYIECPARYRWRHIIGMPDQTADPPDDPEDVAFSAADLGHVVHDILSRLDFSRDLEPQVSELLSGVTDSALRAEAEPVIRHFTGSRWCAELRAADQVLKEVPFEFMIGGKVMAGRIDVLYHTPAGWTVLDYKTGQAEDRDRYELQVGIYAHALHRLTGEMPARAALLMLSIDEEWAEDTSDGSAAGSASERIGDVIASIDAGKFAPSPGHHCKWCAFSSLCTEE